MARSCSITRKGIHNELRGEMVCVSTDFGNNPIKAKIQDAEQLRVHPAVAGLVIGGRDMDAGAVSVRLHGKRPAKREAEGGGRGADFGCDQRATAVKYAD